MKKISIASFVASTLLVSVLSAQTEVIDIHKGWNLVGTSLNSAVDENNLTVPTVVWGWNDKLQSWKAFSQRSKFKTRIQSLINENRLKNLNSFNAGDGFWVQSDINSSIVLDGNETNGSKLLSKGWNLTSFKGYGQAVDINKTVGNMNDISIVWDYDNGKWKAWSPDSALLEKIKTSLGADALLTKLKASTGYWVKMKKASPLFLDLSGSLADGKNIVGSIIKGPIDGATVQLKDASGTVISTTQSNKGLFLFPEQNLTSPYYTLESSGGSYEDEATHTVVHVGDTQGLKTLLTKEKLQMILGNKEYIAMTPETTIYTDVVLSNGVSEEAMRAAKTLIYDAMIKESSPFTLLSGDEFLQTGNFTTPFPKNQSEAFARNRAISFSYMVRDMNLSADKVFDVINLIAEDYKDGSADGISLSDGRDINVSQEFALSRKELFQNTTDKLRAGTLSDAQKAQLDKMGFDATMFDANNTGNMGNFDANNTGNMGSMMNGIATTSSTLADFHYTPFTKALGVPAVASYTVDSEGYKVFHMDINASTTEFFDGIKTITYGVNSSILGQTIRIHNGDKVKLVYKNNLSVPTTMHGHGMHVPAIMDGGPVNMIQPNTSWTAQYRVNQKACTNWYHPHFMNKTAQQVYMGLAGFILIDDNESDSYNLPKEYGVDDIPVAIQDKRFDASGQIDYSPTVMETRMGYKSDVMMANGVIEPFVDVPAKKVRFRLLNGSNASVYKLQFSDKRAFSQIAVDNSFLESPVNGLTSVTLTPGERAEIVVDYTNDMGKTVTLLNANTNLAIMQIRVDKTPTTTSEVPEHLTTLEKYDPATALRTRQFVLNMARGDDGKMHMAINGKLMDIKRIDELVPVGDVEIWEITNQMGMTHNFHIHGTHFFPLERNGSADNILANEKGYKDVISMPGHSTLKIAVKMTDYVTTTETQANGAKVGYMYHCHFLEHEDDGMMGQYAVTDGEVAVNVKP